MVPKTLTTDNISTAFLENVATHGLSWVNEIVGNIPYERIVFELVETAVASDKETISDVVKRLRDLGVMIALDDFGVGQSTLGRLQATPVDFVKVDGHFIRSATESARAARILEGIVDLAHASGASCVIEGIETAEQLQKATQTGAMIGQGFHLGKPRPRQHRAP